MSNSVPGSPVPTGSNILTTERTRLLNTSTTSYSTRQEVHEETSTVITMGSSSQDSHHHFLNGSGNVAIATTRNLYNNIISAGQPSIPTHQLTEKIQDILVFSEIKKKQQERTLIDEKKQNKRAKQNQSGNAAVPSSSSSSSSSSDSDSDTGSTRILLKNKLSEWSLDGSKSTNNNEGGKRLRKRDYAVDALKFATDKWKTKHGWATGSNNSSSASLFANEDTTTTTTTATTLNNNGYGNSTSNGAANNITVVKQKKKQAEGIPSSAESIFNVAKNASVCAVLALLHERRQSSGHSMETDVSLQSLALSTLNLGLKLQDKSTSHVVLYEMLTNKWLNGKSGELYNFVFFLHEFCWL
jgi:hypothetical protein